MQPNDPMSPAMPFPASDPTTTSTHDVLPLRGIDYVELYVGNARQAAQYYRHCFGFDIVAYAGPETKVRDRASYVLRQGDICLVLTAPLGPEGALADHVRRHGDG